MALIRDARFSSVVNDIVVEFGNSLYQDVMDRFTTGEDVSEEMLRHVWENTTQPNAVWDSPIYEEFFRTIRVVNASLPRERQIRILLGEPPIGGDRIRTPQDLGVWKRWMAQRDTHAAQVVRREVLARKRRALLIYGGVQCLHLQRKNLDANYENYPRTAIASSWWICPRTPVRTSRTRLGSTSS